MVSLFCSLDFLKHDERKCNVPSGAADGGHDNHEGENAYNSEYR